MSISIYPASPECNITTSEWTVVPGMTVDDGVVLPVEFPADVRVMSYARFDEAIGKYINNVMNALTSKERYTGPEGWHLLKLRNLLDLRAKAKLFGANAFYIA